ncbi:MAG: hypothetical protein ACKPEO_15775 [Sphaerospermopsis kisseleviana]
MSIFPNISVPMLQESGVRSRRGEAFGRQIINFMKRLFSECFARTGVRSQEEM